MLSSVYHRRPRRIRAAFIALIAACAGLLAAPSAGVAEVGPHACIRDCFVLTGVTFDGVTAYPIADLAPLYDDLLAREIGTEDLVALAQSITDKYRADGYFLSRAVVPLQPPTGGLARITVYEGYVAEVLYEGDRSSAAERLATAIKGRKPLRLKDMDRQLSLVSDLPGIRARTRLEPVLDDPAQHKMVVELRARRLAGSLYVDNRGAESAGPWQAYARGALNSAFQSGDQLSVGVFTIPQDPREFTQVEIAYVTQLRAGIHARAAISGSRSKNGSAALSTTFGQESAAINLRLFAPLKRGRDGSLWLSGGFDARRVEQDWTRGGSADELRIVRLGAYGDRKWSAGYSTGLVQMSRGLAVAGATTRKSSTRSRWNADGQFWKANAQLSHYKDLGANAGIYWSVDGQWSSEGLLGSEEFALGGLPYGRAYNYSEIVGDRGIAGVVELRAGWRPQTRGISFLQTYAFLDGGRVWNLDAPVGWRSASLRSAGVGLRLQVGDRLNVRLEASRPLARAPFERKDKDWRPFISVTSTF